MRRAYSKRLRSKEASGRARHFLWVEVRRYRKKSGKYKRWYDVLEEQFDVEQGSLINANDVIRPEHVLYQSEIGKYVLNPFYLK